MYIFIIILVILLAYEYISIRKCEVSYYKYTIFLNKKNQGFNELDSENLNEFLREF